MTQGENRLNATNLTLLDMGVNGTGARFDRPASTAQNLYLVVVPNKGD